jgi:3-hydroxyacyl-[acyl-carrier-protein] dehydratase
MSNAACQAEQRRPNIIGFTELKERYLPHRYPLLLLDRVTDYEPRRFIEAIKCVTGNSPEMVGHFPERAILPGTAIVQAFAQLAIVFYKLSTNPLRDDEITLISSVSARFLAPVPPGETLILRMTPKRFAGDAAVLNAEARIGDRDVARGSLSITRTQLHRFSAVPW